MVQKVSSHVVAVITELSMSHKMIRYKYIE